MTETVIDEMLLKACEELHKCFDRISARMDGVDAQLHEISEQMAQLLQSFPRPRYSDPRE